MTQSLVGYGAFFDILQRLQKAIVTEMQDHAGRPNRSVIMPGAIAWDDCDDCGLLALSTVRTYLSNEFPIENSVTAQRQGAILCADMVITVVRCAPQPQGNSTSPNVDALETTAAQVLDDAFSVLCVTTNLLQDLTDTYIIHDFMVRSQLFQGPAGACVGSDTLFVVGIER